MIAAFGARNRDECVRRQSSSGGVFLALCKDTVDRGGVVYGALLDKDMRVVHGRGTTYEGCVPFSGSKYVQSDMGGSYHRVRDDLASGRSVLFSGTPCQVAGLRSYLEMTGARGDLLAVDLVCHGVPSPLIWAEHVDFLRATSGARLLGYRFRDKTKGWHRSGHVAILDSGAVIDRRVAAFQDVFNYNYALRPSCTVCPFASLDRVSDLTLGDFWGVENLHPELDDDQGVSLVLVNTDVGEASMTAVAPELVLLAVDIAKCMQPNLRAPTPASKDRDAFWGVYRRRGYEAAIRRFTRYGLVRRVARGFRRSIRRWRS